MPDPLFAAPRLAQIYDVIEGERHDLDHYLATLTGNTSQVFLADQEWTAVLRGIHAALRPGGHLVFEARDPDREVWPDWTREATWCASAGYTLAEVRGAPDRPGRDWVFIARKPLPGRSCRHAAREVARRAVNH